jgi:hypothetical protein
VLFGPLLLPAAIRLRVRLTRAKLVHFSNTIDGITVQPVNYCFPKTWPNDRELRARIIGEWLTTEASYLAS